MAEENELVIEGGFMSEEDLALIEEMKQENPELKTREVESQEQIDENTDHNPVYVPAPKEQKTDEEPEPKKEEGNDDEVDTSPSPAPSGEGDTFSLDEFEKMLEQQGISKRDAANALKGEIEFDVKTRKGTRTKTYDEMMQFLGREAGAQISWSTRRATS